MYYTSVSLRDIIFSYQKSHTKFFDKLSIDFKPGRINFICGKNGVGKSTLLKIMTGDVPQHDLQGSLVLGHDVYNLDNLQQVRNLVGLVAQNINGMIVEGYSFYENISFALLSEYPGFSYLPDSLCIPDFLTSYGIDFNIPVERLSGGQRQILAIIMVLQRSPKVLLLDEPTAALDEENAKLVMNFLQEICLQRDITIIAIVHSFDLVETYGKDFYFQLYQQDGVRAIKTVLL